MARDSHDTVGLTPYIDAMRAFIEHPNGLGEDTASNEPVTTISIEGRWGSGKSTFIEHLSDALIEDGVPVVHFRPWVHSNPDDLWMAFAAAFHDQVRRHLRRRDYFPRMADLWVRRRFYWGRDRANPRWLRIVTWVVISLLIGLLLTLGGINLVASAIVHGVSPLQWLGDNIQWTIVVSIFGATAIILRSIPMIFQLFWNRQPPRRVPEVNRVESDFVELVQALCPKQGGRFAESLRRSQPERRRSALSRRAVVFIDDLDRCESMGVAETLRILSMLVNDRSNVFIVMAFDREQVASLLAKERFELAP